MGQIIVLYGLQVVILFQLLLSLPFNLNRNYANKVWYIVILFLTCYVYYASGVGMSDIYMFLLYLAISRR
jgi:hypothetical protein